ncbi:MAG TPA: hypothetical protein PKZ76_02530 [Xanthomonadaceae bacterium]|nr:hypothetical protein [Xanthomonadaceae bacterium]
MSTATRRGRRTALGLAALSALSFMAAAQEWSIDWSSIDGGGEIAAEGGVWELSGTVGQWDASQAPHVGGVWTLQGGFWTLASGTPNEAIFRDGFED